MNRAELERLDREALIACAEAAGVARARILTRPELVDELLLRSSIDPDAKRRSRGWFGVARDLLARAVERGLHLPDAAQRIRALGEAPVALRPSAPAALPTVTLAEIYAAQGHRDRAIETLEGVLGREPEHAAARALHRQLLDATYPVPPPRMPPEGEEGTSEPVATAPGPETAAPQGGASAAPQGGTSGARPEGALRGADECVAIPVDPRTLYVSWEVRTDTLAFVRAARPGGALGLRIVVLEPTWDGPRSSTRDQGVTAPAGEVVVPDLPFGSIVRAAIGWFEPSGFVPIAHSPALETPAGLPAPAAAGGLVRWTTSGTAPVTPADPDAGAIARALARARGAAARPHAP